jgi:serine/threonine-protein kinase
VYGASAVLWEALTGAALFDGPNESAIVHRVLYEEVRPPSAERAEIPKALDEIVLRGLSRDAAGRFETARDMALALESSVGLATQSAVTAWLQALAGELLAERAESLAEMQDQPQPDAPDPQPEEQPAKTRPIPRSAPAAEPARALEASEPGASTADASGSANDRAGRYGTSEGRRTNGSSSARRPVSRNARAAALWLLGVLLVASVYAVMWARGSISSARQAASVPSSPAPAPAPPRAAVDGPSAAPGDPATPGSLIGATADPQPPTPLQPAAAAAKPPRPRPSRAQRPIRAPDPHEQPPKPKANESSPESKCALFYYIDDKGIRRPKPECL